MLHTQLATAHTGQVSEPVPAEAKSMNRGRILPGSSGVSSDYMRIINHEFRNLQLDSLLTKMSVFDLIDHCAALFEELTQNLHTDRGFRSYVRSFLIFNYFVNTFIMVHFNGFAKFMESLPQDFIIYLNLYNFFRLDDILGVRPFDIELPELRNSVIQYLQSKKLLTFDVDLLYGWLNDYVDYLKYKDNDADNEARVPYYQTDSSRQYGLALHLHEPVSKEDTSESEEDISDFSARFPDVRLLENTRDSTTPGSTTPYPMGAESPVEKEVPPYPVNLDAVLKILMRPPVPIPLAETVSRREVAPSPPPVPRHTVMYLAPQLHNHHHQEGTSLGFSNLQPRLHTHILPDGNHPTHAYPVESTSLLTYSQPPEAIKIRLQTFPEGHNVFFPPSSLLHTQHASTLGSQPHLAVPTLAPPRLQNGPTVAVPGDNGPTTRIPGNHASGSHMSGTNNYARNDHGGSVVVPVTGPNHIQNSLPNVNSNYNHKIMWMRTHAVCGLKNMGSSCYINLTVQVLFGLERFNHLFSDPDLGFAIRHRHHHLVEAVVNLLATFNANGGANIAPTKFLRALTFLKPDFNIPFEQQDAQEFLLFMIDKLHEELARKPKDKDVDYIAKWNINVNPNERDEYLKWYQELVNHEGESPINDMCQGHVQSKLICNTCGYKSASYSLFSILSLSIPNVNSNVVDLTDCLKYYTQDEVLSGDNAWHCPKCNKEDKETDKKTDKENPMDVVFQPKRNMFGFPKRSKSPMKKHAPASSSTPSTAPAPTAISIKRLSFIKLPQVLFIHLSRFSMFGTDKLNTDIVYPLRLKFNHTNHDIYYNLTGLVNHYGNLKSGHYTALVNKALVNGKGTKDNLQSPSWCYFDDDHIRINVPHGDVNSSDSNKFLSQDVYVLCYERI